MSKPLPVSLPLDLLAVVLDTNSTGGDLQLPRIAELADLMDEQDLDEAEIWIPEPVIWEWAEHTYRRLKSFEGASRKLDISGLPELRTSGGLPNWSVADVVSSIDDALKRIDRVSILRLVDQPQAAIQGLRDQVLQIGAGKLKGDVKTGAADSAILRLVEEAAGDSLEDRCVVVSADGDTRRHFANVVSPIVIRDMHLLRLSVLAMVPSEQEVTDAASEAIQNYLRRFVADVGEQLEYETLDGDVDRATSWHENYGAERSVGVSHLDRIGPVEIVEVSRKAGYAAANADITLTLYSQSVWYDPRSDSTEQDDEVFSDVPAVASVWADRDGDHWEVRIETLFVPAEDSAEARRVMAALDEAGTT